MTFLKYHILIFYDVIVLIEPKSAYILKKSLLVNLPIYPARMTLHSVKLDFEHILKTHQVRRKFNFY